MISRIFRDVAQHRGYVDYLKTVAPLYPKIHVENWGEEIYATTIVILHHGGESYKRHIVESIIPTEPDSEQKLTDRLNCNALLSIDKGVPICLDDKITTQ